MRRTKHWRWKRPRALQVRQQHILAVSKFLSSNHQLSTFGNSCTISFRNFLFRFPFLVATGSECCSSQPMPPCTAQEACMAPLIFSRKIRSQGSKEEIQRRGYQGGSRRFVGVLELSSKSRSSPPPSRNARKANAAKLRLASTRDQAQTKGTARVEL